MCVNLKVMTKPTALPELEAQPLRVQSPTFLEQAHLLLASPGRPPRRSLSRGGLQKDEEAGSSEPPESAALRSAEHSITERMRHAKEAGISWVPLWAPLTGWTRTAPTCRLTLRDRSK